VAVASQPTPSAWSPLRHRVYRGLFLAQFASNVGTWMQTVGAQWLMGDLGGGPLEVALVQTAMTLPVFLTVVPAGALGDIVDRRRLLIAAQTGMLVAAATLAAITLAGLATIGLLLGLTFALGLGQAMVMPSWQAIQPELVEKEEIPQAATLGGVNMNVARAVGPAIGGVVIAGVGPGAVFALNAVSFLATLGALARWQRPPVERRLGAEPIGAAMRAGARFVRSTPAFRILLGRAAAFMVVAGAAWALLPVIARDRLELSSGGYGLLLAAVGLGALGGAFVLPSVRARLPINPLVTIASLVYAGCCAILAVTHSTVLVVCVLPVIGLAWISVLSSLNAGAQLMLPAWARARGLAFYQLTFMGGQAAGGVVWGTVAERAGLETALWAVAGGLVAGAALSRRFRLRVPDLDLTPARYWAEPYVEIDAEPAAGPVLVSIEYRVDPADAAAFRKAMVLVGRSRRRTGAQRWGLFQDFADATRFVEVYLVGTWGEHLRQHEERVTVRDQEIEAAAHALLAPGSEPVVSHLLAASYTADTRPASAGHA
jgi:MFS family permease